MDKPAGQRWDEILKKNPGLKKDKLKVGEIIKLP